MIYGIGTDIINIERVEQILNKNKDGFACAEGFSKSFFGSKAFGTIRSAIAFIGHGLTLENTRAIAQLPEIVELNIGHSIIARAVFVGLESATNEMKNAQSRVHRIAWRRQFGLFVHQ
jgi:hypothetical protein